MKLNYKRVFFIGFAFLSICSFWQVYDNVIPLILQNTFHFKEATVGAIMAADNVLALFLLPLVGAWSDKVHTRIGKRMPFIVGGTIAAVIFMLMLPFADQSANLSLFLVALCGALLSMAMYRSPAVALMPDLTPKPLRSKANAIINLMGAIGGVYALLLMMFLISKENPEYQSVYLGVAILMVVAVAALFFSIRENEMRLETMKEDKTDSKDIKDAASTQLAPPVFKSLCFLLASIFLWFFAYNAVTTAFSRYVTVVWKLEGGGFASCLLVATVAAIFSYLPIGYISSKIGRKKTILIGILMMTACYTVAIFIPVYTNWINVLFAIIGIGWASINVNSFPMVVEMSQSKDIGKYTGLYYTFSMASQIITPIVSGVLLQTISYRTLFPYAAFFSIASFFTMLMVRHGDNRPGMKKDILENYDV